MSSKREGTRLVAGALMLVLGAGVLTLPFLPGSPAQTLLGNAAPANVLTAIIVGVGVLLLLLGFLALRAQPDEDDAFEEVKRPEPAPQEPQSTPSSRSTRKAKQATKELSEEVKRIRTLEARIKKLNRRINQAKVKLGTGKLSPEGYKRIVDELSEKRAVLEEERVDLELDNEGF